MLTLASEASPPTRCIQSFLFSDLRTVNVQYEGKLLEERRNAVRCVLVQQVLGTDMKKHFEILSRFQVQTGL